MIGYINERAIIKVVGIKYIVETVVSFDSMINNFVDLVFYLNVLAIVLSRFGLGIIIFGQLLHLFAH